MACLETLKTDQHQGLCPSSMSPRISFSNDFVDTQLQATNKHERSTPSSSSSDFEFSVTNFAMTSTADELFFKGRLLPFKDNSTTQIMSSQKTTLRDELLVDDDDDSDVAFRPPKSPGTMRWRELLGLKIKTNTNNVMMKKGIVEKSDDDDNECIEGREEEAQGSGGSRLIHAEVDLNEISEMRREIEI